MAAGAAGHPTWSDPPALPPAPSGPLAAELAVLAPVPMRRPRRQLALVVGAAAGYVALLLQLLTLRPDRGELPAAWFAGVAVAWACSFVIPTYVALVPRRGAVSPRSGDAAAATLVSAITGVVLGLAVHPRGASSLSLGWAGLGTGHACLELGMVIALAPLAAGALCLRGTLPIPSRWVAAALGAGAGSLSALVLHLYCRIADGPHIGAVHGGVVVVAALLSAALVPRITDRP